MPKLILVALLWLAALPLPAAPRVPVDDAEVLERLPLRPRDPAWAELRALRATALASPTDPATAVPLARRYFALAMAEGDPSYVGYAQAALAAAAENWQSQREPRDALILLQAARAARNSAAAGPVLEWLQRTGFKDPRMSRVAAELR